MFRFSLQTMSLTDPFRKYGVFESFKKAVDIGYNSFEISGHFNFSGAFAADVQRSHDELGVEICALSVDYNGGYPRMQHDGPNTTTRLMEDLDNITRICGALGCRNLRYAGAPVAKLTDMDTLYKYFELTEKLAAEVKSRGLRLCAHNHQAEFARIGGKTVYDWSLELAPDLCYELDIYGAQLSGVDFEDIMKKAAGRIPIMHAADIQVIVKDAEGPGGQSIRRVPLGDGNINIARLFKASDEYGVENIIIELSDFYGEDEYEALKRPLEHAAMIGYGGRT